MSHESHVRGGRRIASAIVVVGLSAALAITGTGTAAAVPPPPPNPSDQQIQAGEQHASATAAEVGKLSGRLSTTQAKIQRLQDAMELKAELAMKARVDLETAQKEAAQARQQATDAQQAADEAAGAIDEAQKEASQFAAASFRQGYVLGSMAAFLDAGSMSQIAARQEMIDQVSGNQSGVLQRLHTAQAEKANLDSKAEAAVDRANAAETKAADAKKAADKAQREAAAAFKQGQQQLKKLEDELAQQQQEYQSAVNSVAALKSQRAQYNAWVAAKQAEEQRIQDQAQLQAARAQALREQQEKQQAKEQSLAATKEKAVSAEKTKQAKIRAEAIRKAKEAAARKRAAEEAARKKAAEEAARKAAEEAARQKAAEQAAAQSAAEAAASNASNDSGDSGDSDGGSTSSDEASSSTSSDSSYSGSVGEQVVQAALAWVGTTYAWGGGNQYGPSQGIHDWGVADYYGDYNKVGFDCSGLALYAWAQVGVYLPHYSAYQYNYGTHISSDDLQPGDLVFYATNIYDPSTIHHVAIYIGNGQMVEAPYSGGYVRVRPLRTSGYIGATRPGT